MLGDDSNCRSLQLSNQFSVFSTCFHPFGGGVPCPGGPMSGPMSGGFPIPGGSHVWGGPMSGGPMSGGPAM